MTDKRLLVVLAVGLAWGSAQRLYASDMTDLSMTLDGLAQKNTSLRERLQKQRETTQRLKTKIQSLETIDQALAKQAKHVAERPLSASAGAEPQGIENEEMPKLSIRVFGSAGYKASFLPHGEMSHAFRWNDHTVTYQGALTDRVSMIFEHVFRFQDDLDIIPLDDMERAEMHYLLSDYAKLTVGLVETPLGYWNQAFKHSGWLQTTIDRPDVYEFHEPRSFKGGLLPIQSTGIDLEGSLSSEIADLNYHVGVFNGRERKHNFGNGFRDENDFKATNFLFTLVPYSLVDGLQVGFGTYLDKIPPAPEIIGVKRTEDINELILSYHVSYAKNNLELLSEMFWINHDNEDSEQTFKTVAGYVQGSYRIKKWTPYYRFDLVDKGGDDPYYVTTNFFFGTIDQRDGITDHFTHTIGVRWDYLTWSAIKLEYRYIANHRKISEQEVELNTSYVF